MAHSYDLSLAPVLREQISFYQQLNQELTAHVRDSYADFLSFIDAKSQALSDKPEYESLQQVYQRADDRCNALLSVLDEESEHITYWSKELADIEQKGDAQAFADVAHELIEQGDYKRNAQEFKTWLSADVAGLKQELTELLDDWRSCVEQGEVDELAYLLEALDDDDAQRAQDDDSDEQGGGCADTQEGCCGRQTPCCRTQTTDE